MKIKWGHLIALLVFCMGTIHETRAQDEKFKAIFVYNYTKYIKWPTIGNEFVIQVLGSGAIANEIEQISMKKTVGNAAIKTVRVGSVSEITTCQILFIAAGKTSMLPEIAELAKRMHILIITEKPNACQNGSGINFVTQNGKLGFEISKANIESCGLIVSSELLKMGMNN
jgi:hypothetical protein